jgi:hypothetical protein
MIEVIKMYYFLQTRNILVEISTTTVIHLPLHIPRLANLLRMDFYRKVNLKGTGSPYGLNYG